MEGESSMDADAAATITPTADLPQETLQYFRGDELRARVFHDKYALRAPDGTVVEWKDRLGRLSARFSRNDPDLKLIIDRNQVLLEAVWEERSFIDLVKLGVMAGGELVKAHDDEPGHVVTVERYEGRLRIVTASDDLSDHLLSIAHESIEQFNLGRIN